MGPSASSGPGKLSARQAQRPLPRETVIDHVTDSVVKDASDLVVEPVETTIWQVQDFTDSVGKNAFDSVVEPVETTVRQAQGPIIY